MKLIILVLCMIIGTNVAQLDPDQMPSEWLPEQFPNPNRNPQACGLRNKAGYVCDPNRLLTQKEIETLDWLMKGMVQNDTRCPCSVWACEQKQQGYSVSVAIMRKMKIPSRSMKALDQAQVFAHYLESSHWHFGRCEEGIVVLYSKEDNVIFFSAGATALKILTNDVARAIGHQVTSNFKNGNMAHGFFETYLLLRNVLNGNTMYALVPSAQALHGSASLFTVAISTLIMTLTTLCVVS